MTKWMGDLSSSFEGNEIASNLAFTLAIFVCVWLSRLFARFFIDRRIEDDAARYRWHKSVAYGTGTFGAILFIFVWLGNLGNLATFFGLVSAGVAITLRDPLANLAAWIYILLREPFEIGDRIEVAGTRGDVIDVRPFAFTLMEVGNWVRADQSTGRVVHVPNSRVFSEPVGNYTQAFEYIWHEIPITVSFESDWRLAKSILDSIGHAVSDEFVDAAEIQLRRAASRFKISVGTLTPKVYTRVVGDGVQLTLRHLTPVRHRRGMEEAIWEGVLDAFAVEPTVQLAYRTSRVVNMASDSSDESAPEEPGSADGVNPVG